MMDLSISIWVYGYQLLYNTTKIYLNVIDWVSFSMI